MNWGNKEIERLVTDELIQLSIPRNLAGFYYLRYAILIVIRDSQQLKNITSGLYPSIAIKYETTSTRVERAIRHAIESGYSKTSTEKLNKFFGNSLLKKPTNSQFIATVSDEIRLKIS